MIHAEVREESYVSIPHGGPIYVPDMISPLTRVPDFESAVFLELQSLKEELSFDHVDMNNEYFSVDELKLIEDEDLAAKAFEEAFKPCDLDVDALPVTKKPSRCRKSKARTGQGSERDPALKEKDAWAIVTSETADAMPLMTYIDKKQENKNPSTRRKRKQQTKKNSCLDESCLAKVEELSRIKRKQEETKKAVRLHSFNGSSEIPKSQYVSVPKGDTTKFLRSAAVSKEVRATATCDHVPVNFPETVLCFEVHHPRRPWSKTQEFLVLGRQFLTEVKDKINCATDEMMKKEGLHNPSGYFLIEDCFCNDTRSPMSSDYSKPILDWLETSKDVAQEKWEYIVSGELQHKQKAVIGINKKIQLPKFRSVQMQTTRFCDLGFRLGAGYLYCHGGDCKHVIVIRDMRLIHPEDLQNRAAYPLLTYRSKFRHTKCSVCKIFMAHKVTIDDKWAAPNPAYFCDICYYMLHYGEGGSLLYSDFSVYEYLKE